MKVTSALRLRKNLDQGVYQNPASEAFLIGKFILDALTVLEHLEERIDDLKNK
jgi:hypothetical protein